MCSTISYYIFYSICFNFGLIIALFLGYDVLVSLLLPSFFPSLADGGEMP